MIIYKITNLLNRKIYVGKSKTINEKYYGSGVLIKQAIKKYGIENFNKEIIDTAETLEDTNKKEIFWIKQLKAYVSEGGYNLTYGGDGGDTLTLNPRREEILANRDYSYLKSDNYRKIMSDAMSNNENSINSKIGKHLSKEHKNSISNGIQEALKNTEKRNKISHKGVKKEKPFSKEHCDKLSKLHKDKPKSKEHKENIRKAIKGKKRCPICHKYFEKNQIDNHILTHKQK